MLLGGVGNFRFGIAVLFYIARRFIPYNCPMAVLDRLKMEKI
jgi:hypothetical protein